MKLEVPIGTVVEARLKIDEGKYTDWMPCVRVDRNTLRVIANDPLWYGSRWNMRKDAGVEVRR